MRTVKHVSNPTTTIGELRGQQTADGIPEVTEGCDELEVVAAAPPVIENCIE